MSKSLEERVARVEAHLGFSDASPPFAVAVAQPDVAVAQPDVAVPVVQPV